MSDPSLSTFPMSPSPAVGDEPPAAVEDEDSRLLAAIRLEVDAFAAEVRRELNSIRSLLHQAPGNVRYELPANPSTLPRSPWSGPETAPQATTDASWAPSPEMNSQDRIAALKRRLAAKLQSEQMFLEPSHAEDAADDVPHRCEEAES